MRGRLFIWSFVYISFLSALSIYWANNYQQFISRKGGELISFVKYLLLVSYLFLFLIQFVVKRINFILLLIQPISVLLLSFVTGIIFLLISGLEGIAKYNILTFGFAYTVITILFIYLFWYKNITRDSNA